MANILVLAGGTSDEREVSLRSGAAVAAALQRAGHEARQHDPANGLDKTVFEGVDVAFPVLHGKGGEDGALQSQMDKLGVSYVGTGAEASALCFDKWRYKQFLRRHDLPNADGALVDEAGFWHSELVQHPFVLKPHDGGSSVDMLINRDTQPTPDKQTIHALFERHPKMMLEQLIEGSEITVAALGDEGLPVIEIIPPSGGEFDYENKYNGCTQELCPPEHVDDAIQAAARKMALRVHRLTGCRDFSRTDFMIDDRQRLYILETNTIPGMTDQSLFPKAASVAGLSMERLVDRLVRFALQR